MQDLIPTIYDVVAPDFSKVSELCARYESLTTREREVMELVVVGMLNKQVGTELGISEITVKTHRANMMRKMNARSLAELVTIVILLNLRWAHPALGSS